MITHIILWINLEYIFYIIFYIIKKELKIEQ